LLKTALQQATPGAAPQKGGSGEAAPPLLPDGIGLDLETVRAMLALKHTTIVATDDPVMMLVTLNNAFLNEYEKLLKRHNDALTAYLESAAGKHLEATRQASEAITQGLSATSVGAIQAILQKHKEALVSFQNNMGWLTAIVAISAAINVAVFVYRKMM
jgi:hypothetical protein